ncbi:MAG: sll1863 family stress response protein [Pseudohaliea sp.]
MTSRDEFVQKLKDQIDALNSEIDDLEARARETSGEVEEELGKQRARVEEQREQFYARLESLKQAGEDNWERMRGEAEHALKALRNSVHYFRSHFR